MDPRIDKLASVLVHYSLNLKKGNWFKIMGPYQTLPLVKAVYKKALEVGAYPYFDAVSEDLQEIFFKYGSDEQLKFMSETRMLEARKLDSYLYLWGADNTKFLSGVDPKKQAIAQAARREYSEVFFKRVADGELHWCGTLFPNNAMAQEAEKSLSDFEDFVYSAGFCDTDDPIGHWQRISKVQEALCNKLNTFSTLHIKSADTDLRMSIKGRKWINCDGTQNFPDGEVFTGPIEDSVNGTITFSYPACYGGREVENVQLTFKDGLVTKFTAGKNYEFLKQMLEMDEGAKRVGEFAIGTNYHIQTFSKNTLFDEKIGGTCHLAVGNSLYESGGVNKSALHWDMVCELRKGGEIYADDQLLYKDGKFIAGFAD